MREEGCDLSLGVVGGPHGAKFGVELNGFKEGRACVESLPGAARARLLSNAVEETIRHYIANFYSVVSHRCGAGARP